MIQQRLLPLTLCASFTMSVSAQPLPFSIPISVGYPPVQTIDYSTGLPLWHEAASNGTNASFHSKRQPTSTTHRKPTSTSAGCNVISASDEMVRHYSAAHRNEAEKVFKELSAGYFEVMRQLKLPPNDVATAVGAFLIGNVSAYRDIDFPDEDVQPFVQQLRSILANDEQFQSSPAGTKSMVCGQLALIGMFMATTRMATKAHPQPETIAGMRQAAKSYLETFLKTDADRVNISARGLVLN